MPTQPLVAYWWPSDDLETAAALAAIKVGKVPNEPSIVVNVSKYATDIATEAS